jgi:hypothetical protein
LFMEQTPFLVILSIEVHAAGGDTSTLRSKTTIA